MLLSGIFQIIWLPYLAAGGIPVEAYTWVVMFATLGPGIALASIAAKPQYQIGVYALNSSVLGGFVFIGIT